jgi:menaquinone-dependent protoporphyrinogen oxidase
MQQQSRISRRRFLAWGGGALGAGLLSCSGLGLWATHQPKTDLVGSSCGDPMTSRVLVTYASRAGSTGEVAQAIGQTLCEQNVAADVLPVDRVSRLDGYSAVIVGAAIYMGRWLSPALKFVQTHRDTLRQLPTAYFLVCGTLQENTDANRRTVATYLDPLRESIPEVVPVETGLFAGRIDAARVSPLYGTIIKAMGSPQGDFRDWDAIRAWATQLPPSLTTT